MAGSRSASQRKRKRDTTSQAVDLLNNLHNPTDRVSFSSPTRPQRPLRRQTARKTQSPEESRSAVSRRIPRTEPITPRRSRRIQTNAASESTPSRKGGLAQFDGSKLGNGSYSGSDDSSEYESEEDTNVVTKRSSDTGIGQRIRNEDEYTRRDSIPETPTVTQQDGIPNLKNEGADESSGSSSDEASDEDIDESEDPTQLSSPKAQPQSTRKDPRQSEIKHDNSSSGLSIQGESDVSISAGEDDESGDDSTNNSGNTFHKPDDTSNHTEEKVQNNYEENDPMLVNLFSSDDGSDGYDSDSRTREFSPSQQLQQEQEMNVKTKGVQKENTVITAQEQGTNANSKNAAKDTVLPDRNVEANTDIEAVIEDASEGSVFSPSEEEPVPETSSAASGLFRYSPDSTEDVPSPAPPRQKKVHSRSYPRQRPVVEIPRWQRTSSDSQGSRNRANRPDDWATVEEEESSWFAEAKQLGGQAGNWDVLISETLAVYELVDPSRLHYFREIQTLMESLRKEHATVLDDLENKRQPLSETRQECKRLRGCLDDEGDRLRDMIYWRSMRGDEYKRLSGKLAEGFEACVYYPMVVLILQCFKAYRYSVRHRLFRRAYDHLHETMNLLHKFCRRSNAQATREHPPFRSRGGRLIKALNPLIEALDSGALGTRQQRRRHKPHQVIDLESPLPSQLTPRTRVRSHSPGSETSPGQIAWTEAEGCALVQGLRLWQGPGRYRHILEHYPDELGGRTVQELRAKAQLIREAWFSHIEETARTQAQRQQWHWLLEV